MYMYMSHPRHFFHCLGCAVLLCLVCLFDLACFFLSSFSSLICICTGFPFPLFGELDNTCSVVCVCMYVVSQASRNFSSCACALGRGAGEGKEKYVWALLPGFLVRVVCHLWAITPSVIGNVATAYRVPGSSKQYNAEKHIRILRQKNLLSGSYTQRPGAIAVPSEQEQSRNKRSVTLCSSSNWLAPFDVRVLV